MASRLSAIFFAISIFHETLAADSPTCYFRNSRTDNAQVGTGSFACNNTATDTVDVQLCCNNGDQCGEDSICYYSDGKNNDTGNAGYYMGGCTDGTFSAPQCSNHCLAYAFQNIAWDTSRSQWGCCGDGIEHCSEPDTQEYFSAVAKADWSALPTTLTSTPSASATGTGASSTGSPATNVANPTFPATNPIPTLSDNQDTGLSTGAQAGIGVGVAAGALALVALAGFVVLQKRRKNRRQGNAMVPSSPGIGDQKGGYPQYPQQNDISYNGAYQPVPQYQAQNVGIQQAPLAEVSGQAKSPAEMEGVGSAKPKQGPIHELDSGR